MDKYEIGQRIMRLRKKLGMTQEAFSEQLGISKNHLSGIECGKYTVTTSFIFKLCALTGKTPDYFLIGRVYPETDDLTNLIRGLSENEQQVIIQLIQTYKSVKPNLREIPTKK